MKKHKRIAAGTVLLAGLTAAPALAAANGPQVSVRIEGLKGTVLAAKSIHVPASGSITKDGIKSGLCPADSAQGALGVATGGNWKGIWYASYHEYEVTSILGVTPNAKKDYFEIFVNHVSSSSGACEIKLTPGAQLLFAVVPDAGKAETPLTVTTRASGSHITATVVGYSKTGRASPLKGASVALGSTTAKTGADGVATLAAPSHRTTLVATAHGYIRDETSVAGQSAS